MRWFRRYIGQSAWLALTALAMNLALSFGHIHPIGHSARGAVVAPLAPTDSQKPGHQHDGLADELCQICLAALAIANGVASAPPALPHPIAYSLLDRASEPQLASFESPRAAFQSRAPPIS
jgi:hypothetical protein